MMPHLDELDVCRLVRDSSELRHLYLILLTAKSEEDDLVEGLQAGADDYLDKPCSSKELRARLQLGFRVIDLQASLAGRVRELQEALAREKQLQGLLPICSYCKKIREDGDYWTQVERYIEDHDNVAFSHGICPDCFENRVKPEIEEFKAKNRGSHRITGRYRLISRRPNQPNSDAAGNQWSRIAPARSHVTNAERGQLSQVATMDERYLAIKSVMMPRDTNPHGTIFGDVILSSVDMARAASAHHVIRARGWPEATLVTVSVEKVEFLQPAYAGDIVSFWTQLGRVDRTSITMNVSVEADRDNRTVELTSAVLTYVAIDLEDRTSVPLEGQ